MASRSSQTTPLPPSNAIAGWDIAVAAFALACMTAGFWRLWPNALVLNDAPFGPIILKAGIAALGFVGVASRWEDTMRATVRNPFGLVLIALACGSAIWAMVPGETVRNGILLLVIWCFGIALALRFKASEFSEICGFAGIFAVVMQVTAHEGVPPVDHFDGDLAFALVACAWAAMANPARRTVWMISAGLCFAFAFASTERATFGAILGFVFGLGLAFVGGSLAKRGTISILIAAWGIVAAIVMATAFIMFAAVPVFDSISLFFTNLGTAMIIGNGFGAAGQSVGDSLGAGLGVLGTGVALLVVLSTSFQALFGNPSGNKALMGQAGVCFACVGAMLVSPQEVAMFGPLTILFAATSFSISLACVPKRRARQALFEARKPAPKPQRLRKPRPAIAQRTRHLPSATADFHNLGLRPRQ
jgi:hypothetical protein